MIKTGLGYLTAIIRRFWYRGSRDRKTILTIGTMMVLVLGLGLGFHVRGTPRPDQKPASNITIITIDASTIVRSYMGVVLFADRTWLPLKIGETVSVNTRIDRVLVTVTALDDPSECRITIDGDIQSTRTSFGGGAYCEWINLTRSPIPAIAG